MKCCPCCERLSWLLGMVFHQWSCSRVCHRYSVFCSLYTLYHYTLYHYTPSTPPALSDGCTPQMCAGIRMRPCSPIRQADVSCSWEMQWQQGLCLCTSEHPYRDSLIYSCAILPSRRCFRSGRCGRPAVYCLLGVLFFPSGHTTPSLCPDHNYGICAF